jgi:hypothetical protein
VLNGIHHLGDKYLIHKNKTNINKINGNICSKNSVLKKPALLNIIFISVLPVKDIPNSVRVVSAGLNALSVFKNFSSISFRRGLFVLIFSQVVGIYQTNCTESTSSTLLYHQDLYVFKKSLSDFSWFQTILVITCLPSFCSTV